jgi:hypothetical protein
MKAVLAGMMLALVAGCAHSPDVLDIGAGRYSLTVHAQMGFGSSRQEAVDAANEYCDQRHQSAVIGTFEDTGPDPLVGYTTSVTFTCGTATK